jgi:hypothetical protein
VPVVASIQASASSKRFQPSMVKVKPAAVVTAWP